jgi:hypothetical protein
MQIYDRCDDRLRGTRKIGFTGNRVGMSIGQMAELGLHLRHLKVYQPSLELHHGMCVGADVEANTIALSLGMRTVGHPPLDSTQAVNVQVHEKRPNYGFLVRNHHIVDECGILFVAPRAPEILRSGTWATKRYAEKKGVPFIILSWE